MDSNRFDTLTRALAGRRSRRSVFGAIAGGLAAALGEIRATNADIDVCLAFCKSVFPPGRQRGQCISQAQAGQGPCALCAGEPDRFCEGECVDLQTDQRHCGRCGIPCVGGTCSSGACDCTIVGQSPDDDGFCVCHVTRCSTSDDCCNFPDNTFMCVEGKCAACTPYTFLVDDPTGPLTLPCCDGEFVKLPAFLPWICMAACGSDADCVGRHVCLDTGICGCPPGTELSVTGACNDV